MATKNKIQLVWDGYASDSMITDYMDNFNDSCEDTGNSPITIAQAREQIYNDTEYWNMEYEAFTEALTDLMNGREYWRDDASKMGWLQRNGYKVFKADNGSDFIRAISPNTECNYTIIPYFKGFKIRIGHHDAPMGEYHVIKPITEEEYEEQQ